MCVSLLSSVFLNSVKSSGIGSVQVAGEIEGIDIKANVKMRKVVT